MSFIELALASHDPEVINIMKRIGKFLNRDKIVSKCNPVVLRRALESLTALAVLREESYLKHEELNK